MITRLLLALPDWLSSGCISQTAGTEGVPTIKCAEVTIVRILGLVGTVALAIFLVMALLSGLRYATSQGDPKTVEKAKNTLQHAVIGIVLIVIAYLVLRLVEVFTGVPVTRFSITQP